MRNGDRFMTKSRVFAILNWKEERNINVKQEILEKLPLRDKNDKVVIFCKDALKKEFEKNDKYEIVVVSEQEGHNRAALLNTAYKYLKDHYSGYYGYTIYDSVQFKKDPSIFFAKIEEMIEKLHLDIWFNTYTDVMNFVFSKFDPRVSIVINEPKYQSIYNKTIMWTSHANPNITLVDIDKFDFKDGHVFDDRFEIPMFWIIKFLCERARNKQGFMNHYPTIEEEIGVYKIGDFKGSNFSQQQMQIEDKMFSELNLDHTPNQNVEALMEFMMKQLKL